MRLISGLSFIYLLLLPLLPPRICHCSRRVWLGAVAVYQSIASSLLQSLFSSHGLFGCSLICLMRSEPCQGVEEAAEAVPTDGTPLLRRLFAFVAIRCMTN